MAQYSNSPLGLVLTSSSTDGPVVGKYVISGSSSSISSIFFENNDTQSYNFNGNTGDSSSYNNDISTTGIINYTSKISAMRLRSADFAYLKNLGVYPNNRLIVARRFSSPVNDDLTSLKQDVSPVATLVSWVPDNTDFISTTFGEEWTEGEASFRDILNDLGHDVLMGDNSGKKLGDAVSSAANAVALPGFTEGLQYEIFKKLGLTDLDASQLPYGNPNIIKESKRRKTPGKEQAWSGLSGKFNVKMTVEYEQKFINGVDPTVVYYDIIANALTFGTSESKFQFRGDSGNSFNSFLNNIGSGDTGRIKAALLQFVGAISDALKAVGDAIYSALTEIKAAVSQAVNGNMKATLSSAENALISGLERISTTIITGLVNKYKLRIVSVVNSLTGTPSAPWHVTIGNPRRPILSSGDMVMEKVTITMGKTLAFNDLPSSIKLDFELDSARNLGAQELFRKLNSGRERTYSKSRLSFVDTDVNFNKNQINKSKTVTALNQAPQSTTATNTVASGNNNVNNISKTAAPAIYPTAISNLPNSSVTTNSNGTSYVQAPIDELNGKQVLFFNNHLVTDADGNQIGNWEANGKNALLNLNSLKTGKKTITLPGK